MACRVGTMRIMRHHLISPTRAAALLALAGLGLAGPGHAQGAADRATWLFAEAGFATHGTRAATVGLRWPWNRPVPFGNGRLTGHWETYLSRWHANDAAHPSEHRNITQIAFVPVLRWRLDQGRSRWFVEGGIGFSLTDSLYRTPHKTFGTRFNFADHLAVGVNFGERQRHEAALRLQHVSNANIKTPNPGEDFVQLRYSYAF